MTMINKQPGSTPGVHVQGREPYTDVEARPLQLPDFINIVPKNPEHSLRWVNYSVGEKQSTMRLDEMIYAGFVPAKPEECMLKTPQGLKPLQPSLVRDGKIIKGDLILLKIDRKIYEGALKYNHQRAVERIHPDRQLATGRQQLAKAVGEKSVPRAVQSTLAGKLQAYRPNIQEQQKFDKELGIEAESGDLPGEKGG